MIFNFWEFKVVEIITIGKFQKVLYTFSGKPYILQRDANESQYKTKENNRHSSWL